MVDKPAGWTSHDVVARMRGVLGSRRIGHSGTLDPDATGVLLLGVGRVTRLLRFLTALPKEYEGEIVFGTETSTLDASGEVTATHLMPDLAPDAVAAAAATFVGDILQVPPMVSAVKVDGRRLHAVARAGEEVERTPRPVTVQRFDVAPTGDPLVYRARVTCSSGTYIRSLADDLGRALGGGAHLRALRRTRIGSFGLDGALVFSKETVRADVALLSPAEAMQDYPMLVADETTAADVRHGRVLSTAQLGAAGAGPWAVLDPGGALLAVYEAHGDGRAKPAVVIASS